MASAPSFALGVGSYRSSQGPFIHNEGGDGVVEPWMASRRGLGGQVKWSLTLKGVHLYPPLGGPA